MGNSKFDCLVFVSRRSGPISGYSRAETSKLLEISWVWSWVVLIVFSPGLGPLAPALARPSSPDSDCPRKHKHTHNAVPCHAMPCPAHAHAMHLPCEGQLFGSVTGTRGLTQHLCHSLRRRYPKCSVCLECVSLCRLALYPSPLLSTRPHLPCPTPYTPRG